MARKWKCTCRKKKFSICVLIFILLSASFCNGKVFSEETRENYLQEKFVRMFRNRIPAWKLSKNGVFSGPYFPVFGLNLRIQSEYKKIRTRKNSVFGHFSRNVPIFRDCFLQFLFISYYIIKLLGLTTSFD